LARAHFHTAWTLLGHPNPADCAPPRRLVICRRHGTLPHCMPRTPGRGMGKSFGAATRPSPTPVSPPPCTSTAPHRRRLPPRRNQSRRDRLDANSPRQIGNGFEASSKWGRSTVGPTVSSDQLPASRQTDRVVGRQSEKRHLLPESDGVTRGRAVDAASASLRLDRRFEPAFL